MNLSKIDIVPLAVVLLNIYDKKKVIELIFIFSEMEDSKEF